MTICTRLILSIGIFTVLWVDGCGGLISVSSELRAMSVRVLF